MTKALLDTSSELILSVITNLIGTAIAARRYNFLLLKSTSLIGLID